VEIDGGVARRELLGVRVGVQDLRSLIGAAMTSIVERHPPFTFACANPHSLVVAQRDAHFYRALRSCSAVVADGVGVTVGGLIAGRNVGPRITGNDFFLGVMRQLNARSGRVFLLGSTPAVLDRMMRRARREFPNLDITAMAPPFGTWDRKTNADIVGAINDARPDVLWVGMTAPKQEKWVHDNAELLLAPVIGSIGAVFDFYAETTVRAPEIICRAGFEWLYRLIREPKRLWRRTLVSAPMFMWLVLVDRFRSSGSTA
jgi:N-acetylglucosaminyldiphosphoundecaprenol N-acetyl-beta-D-mannosaminyltransferase